MSQNNKENLSNDSVSQQKFELFRDDTLDDPFETKVFRSIDYTLFPPSPLSPPYSSSSVFPKQDFLSKNNIPETPIAGDNTYLEPYRHFYSNTTPEKLTQKISEILTNYSGDYSEDYSEEIDFTYDKYNYRFVCDSYPREEHLRFIIQIYSFYSFKFGSPSFIVEIQRRKGDAFEFSNVYCYICEKLGEVGMIDKERKEGMANPCPKKSFLVPDLLRQDEEKGKNEKENSSLSSLSHLFDMASSPFCDVSSQAISSIAVQSKVSSKSNKDLWNMLENNENLRILIKNLESKSEDVFRPSITSLANILAKVEKHDWNSLKNKKDKKKIMKDIKCTALKTKTNHKTPYVQREINRLVKLLN